MKAVYTDQFYRSRTDLALQSARQIVPLIVEQEKPCSVIDVGCANGIWLSVFIEHGINQILGIDGPWISEDSLRIPKECFLRHDLTTGFPVLNRHFDIAISIEVAEHLPEELAEPFVRYLASQANCVVFSAAIPGQGGTGHINEQWQSYWAQLFYRAGFSADDSMRRRIWNNDLVNVIHAQNIVTYRKQALSDNAPPNPPLPLLDVVHPRLFAMFKSEEAAALQKKHQTLPIEKARNATLTWLNRNILWRINKEK